jgi:hypothetical protein
MVEFLAQLPVVIGRSFIFPTRSLPLSPKPWSAGGGRGFGAYWRRKSRRRGGHRRINCEVPYLNSASELWTADAGAGRAFARRLLMLRIEVAESTVTRYLGRRRQPPSQGWRTFLNNHSGNFASIHHFVARAISFKLPN